MNNFVINENIKAKQVNLIDSTGKSLGQKDLRTAIEIAKSNGFDLLQVDFNPASHAPICKMADAGKLKFEESKKKMPKPIKNKEIMLHLNASPHDIGYRKDQILNFIKKSHRVKFGVEMKGREKAFRDEAQKLLETHLLDFSSVASHDGIKVTDNCVFVILSPSSNK